jgi:hypothetical protein
VYLFAHRAGRYFRERPTEAHAPVRRITTDADGHRNVEVQMRQKTLKARVDPENMTDAQVLAMLKRITAPKKTLARRPARSARNSGPTLFMRG